MLSIGCFSSKPGAEDGFQLTLQEIYWIHSMSGDMLENLDAVKQQLQTSDHGIAALCHQHREWQRSVESMLCIIENKVTSQALTLDVQDSKNAEATRPALEGRDQDVPDGVQCPTSSSSCDLASHDTSTGILLDKKWNLFNLPIGSMLGVFRFKSFGLAEGIPRRRRNCDDIKGVNVTRMPSACIRKGFLLSTRFCSISPELWGQLDEHLIVGQCTLHDIASWNDLIMQYHVHVHMITYVYNIYMYLMYLCIFHWL